MNVKVQTIHFDASEDLLSLVDKKLSKLDKFKDYVVNGEVYLREESDGKVDNKTVEIKLNVKGNTLFAKEESSAFQQSVDLAIEAMQRQLRKHKEKLQH